VERREEREREIKKEIPNPFYEKIIILEGETYFSAVKYLQKFYYLHPFCSFF